MVVMKDLMNKVITFESDKNVRDAAKLMADKGIGSLLLTSKSEICGIITHYDIMKKLVAAGKDPVSTRCSDIMTKNIVTLTPDAHISEAMRLIEQYDMRHFPIKQGGKIVGIVSSTDIVKSASGFSFGSAISEGVTQSKYYYERRE